MEIKLSEYGDLIAPYAALAAVLGQPDKLAATDGKVRVQWNRAVQGVGRVDIYDYKQGAVPVEQVDRWSFKAECATKREIVEMLKSVDIAGLTEMPTVMDILDVHDWVEIDPLADFEDLRGKFPLWEMLGSLDWGEQFFEADVRVGLVRGWLVRWIMPNGDGQMNQEACVQFWDPIECECRESYTISQN